MQQLEGEHAERTQRGYSIETELRENRDRISQIALEIDRAHARRRHNEERCAELLVRAASSEAELAQAQHRLTALEAERESNRQILESAAADLAAAQSDLLLCQQDAAAAAASLAEIERQQEESRVAIFDTVSSRLASAQPTRAGRRAPRRRPIAKHAVWKPRSPTPTFRSKPSADSADNSRSSLKPSRSASAASPKKSANSAG